MKEQDPFKALVKSASGYDVDSLEAETIAVAATLFRDLLIHNWSAIRSIREQSEDSSVSVSYAFEVDQSGKKPIVRARLSYAQKFKDELESWVDDPAQTKLNLNN